MLKLIKEIAVKSGKRIELIDVTDKVQDIVAKSKVKEGICTVYCPHTTAAVIITENADPSVQRDVLRKLNELAPANAPEYTHAEGNSDSHCKSSLLGCSGQVLIKNGKLELGTWQGIFFCEFDGPRHRQVIIQIRGE